MIVTSLLVTPRNKISWIKRPKNAVSRKLLAEDDEKENGEQEEEADLDELTPAVLEATDERSQSTYYSL